MSSTPIEMPQLNLAHKKRLERVEDTEKTFSSKEGMKRKMMLYFFDGYKAEYCPLVGKSDERLKVNSEIWFQVLHRKNFDGGGYSDVIGLIDEPGSKQIGSQRVVQMSGHPATIAISIAKDLAIASKHDDGFYLEDLFSDADKIMDWLVSKV